MKIPAHHPAFLGTSARQIPLASAAMRVASVRAPGVVSSGLEAYLEAGHVGLEVELSRALRWVLAKCCEPHGLGCWHLDPESGVHTALPRTLLWSVEVPRRDAAREWWQLEELGGVVAEALGVASCEPAFDLLVRATELDAHLEPEQPMLLAWLAENLEGHFVMLERAIRDAPEHRSTDFLSSAVEQFPMVRALYELLRLDADDEDKGAPGGSAAGDAEKNVSIEKAIKPFLEVVRGKLVRGDYEARRPRRKNASLVRAIAEDLAALICGPNGPACFREHRPEAHVDSVYKRLSEVIRRNPGAWPGVRSRT